MLGLFTVVNVVFLQYSFACDATEMERIQTRAYKRKHGEETAGKSVVPEGLKGSDGRGLTEKNARYLYLTVLFRALSQI